MDIDLPDVLDADHITPSRKSGKKSFLDFVLNLALIIALAVFIRLFLVEPFNIEGTSMCDTLNYLEDDAGEEACRDTGERILLNKMAYNFMGFSVNKPAYEDIVVFVPPQGRKDPYIKRIIGLPGDTIELKNGDVYLSNAENPEGVKLEEAYLNDKNAHNTFPFGGTKKFVVPEGKYFVMGDNRNASSDSRSCFHLNRTCLPGDENYITIDDIKGKALATIWPLSKMRLLTE